MARRVEISWCDPCRWDTHSDTLTTPDVANANGIYQLTRTWGHREDLLYIGIVWSDTRTMLKRMAEHRDSWLGALRGINYRFGSVTPLRGLTRDRDLLETVEGAIIWQEQPPENDKKKVSYSRYYDIIIENLGSRGALPKYIDTTDH